MAPDAEGGAALPSEVRAEEVIALGHSELGVKARSWVTVTARGAPAPAAASTHDDLAAALAAVPTSLRPATLALQHAASSQLQFTPYKSVEEAVLDNIEAVEGEDAGEGGTGTAALATLRLLPALRIATQHEIQQLLRREHMQHRLPGLCRVLGLAGTLAAYRAVDDRLHLRTEDPVLPHSILYLEGFSLTRTPHTDALTEVLKTGERARGRGTDSPSGRGASVGEAALLAAASAARRVAGAASAVRETLGRALTACGSERCRRAHVLALGNMRRADAADLLLEHATRGDASARVAALHALSMCPSHAFDSSRLDRLTHIALHNALPLEVRAAALDLVTIRRAWRPAPLVLVARELHVRGPHELRRVFWQRLRALAPRYSGVREFLAAVEIELRSWDAQAHAGTTTVLDRRLGWNVGGWSTALDSVQLADVGALRRGLVHLIAHDINNSTEDLFGVEIWTRGLDSFTREQTMQTEQPDREESVTAGLALSVAGTRMRDITLFDGQAELLGHVWSGTGSTPTPVLRALWLAESAEGAAPLVAGAVLGHRWRTTASLALDAHAQVSLWWRTARCQLELRGGGAASAEAALLTAWGDVRAQAHVTTEPRMHVAADLDFYNTVALCVRVDTDNHHVSRNVSLHSALSTQRMWRWRHERVDVEGHTFALGTPNDHVCRTLRAADTD